MKRKAKKQPALAQWKSMMERHRRKVRTLEKKVRLLEDMQHTAAEDGKDIYEFYHDELLPLCKEISYRESDEMVAAAERMAKEAEEEEKGGVSQKRKEEVILAIADPEMTVDAIIDKFFKKDMTAEQRKMVADYIEKVRREQAGKLAKVREMKRKED